MKILFAGTPKNAAVVLRGLVDQGHEIVAVLTRLDAPVGRKRVLTQSAVSQAAVDLGLPVIKANQIDDATREKIAATKADIAIVVAYGVLLKTVDLELLPFGWLNVHFSLLPRLRGAAPVQWSLLNGETETGVTVFQIDEGLDTGAIWSQVATEIQPTENAGDLLNRLSLLSTSIISELLPKIAAKMVSPKPQSGEVGAFARKLSRADAQIHWQNSALAIENQVRALNPEPFASAQIKGNNVQVLEARVSLEQTDAAPGQLFANSGRVYVGTGNGILELIQVRPAGKSALQAADWFRGLREGSFDV